MASLTLGSRGSALALAQSRRVAAQLRELGHELSLRIIRTTGDRIQDRPLPEIGGKGLFTAELDRALLEGEIDLAVHSLKDLPTDLPPGLSLGCVPERESPDDVLVTPDPSGVGLAGLARGARVGTSSVRRRALALAFRPDLDVVPIRGNVDTRLRKLDEGQVDALVLAAAGLRRLGLAARASHALDRTSWIPAPGQGALGIVVREDDVAHDHVAPLEDDSTRAAVTFERTLLGVLGGGCSAPLGAVGLPYRDGIRGWALVASPDGDHLIRADRTGDLENPVALGRVMARELVDRGALDLIHGARSAASES